MTPRRHPVAGRRQPHPAAGRPRYRRPGFLAGAVAAVSLLVAVIALWPAFGSYLALDSSLSVAKVAVADRQAEYSARDVEAGTATDGKADVATLDITLANAGQRAGVVNRVELRVHNVWAPACGGGGGLTTSVRYDFLLPGDIAGLPKPHPLSRTAPQFQVEGLKNDVLGISVGPEHLGELAWNWLVDFSVTLHQNDGPPLDAGRAVLMDRDRLDDVLNLVGTFDHYGDANMIATNKECAYRAVRTLDTALAVPTDRKSPAIQELRDGLAELGYAPGAPAPTTSAAPSGPMDSIPLSTPAAPTPSAAPGSPPDQRRWVAQLASLPGETTPAERERARADHQHRLGAEVKVLESSRYPSLVPGYWVLYQPGPFPDGSAALAFCHDRGFRTESSCVGRYLGTSPEQRVLTCPFSANGSRRNCYGPV